MKNGKNCKARGRGEIQTEAIMVTVLQFRSSQDSSPASRVRSDSFGANAGSEKRASAQRKRVVRHRVRVQTKSRTRRAAVKGAAGPQCKDSCGTRAIAANITKMAVAAATRSQSRTVRIGVDSPAAWRPSMRAWTKSSATL